MPKFDRNVLAKFLPQQQIREFELLNKSVDETLPNAIEEGGALAAQANEAAQQALSRLDEVEVRLNAFDLAPTPLRQQEPDDLAPVSSTYAQNDGFAPSIFKL